MPSPRRHAARLALAALAALVAGRAGAQMVRGSVVDSASGATVTEYSALLVDGQGATVAAAAGGEEGRFTLRAPGPGTYRVRVLRIGYLSTLTPPLALAAGEVVDRRFAMAMERVSLAGITVRARQRCEAGPSDRDAATLWDEVQKAAYAVALTATGQRLRVTVRDVVRELTPDGRRVVHDTRADRRGVSASPYTSPAPDVLAAHGYVQQDGDRVWYYAPDAATLVSDPFVASHCFHVSDATPPTPGLLGLAFEPTRREPPPDVQGVLWIDRATAELRSLEFRYTALPRAARGGAFGGRVAFERVPGGAWMTRAWTVRAPLLRTTGRVGVAGTALGRGTPGSDTALAGIHEEGGEVLAATTAGGAVVWARDGAAPRDSTVPARSAPPVLAPDAVGSAPRCDELRRAREAELAAALAVPIDRWHPTGRDSAAVQRAIQGAAVVLQAIADTTGAVDARTVRVLRTSRSDAERSARASLAGMRFPVEERVPGCRVRREVIVPLRLEVGR